MKYLIAHDLGTTGNKATLFSVEGKLVKSVTHSYKTNFHNGNWAEQNPTDWWEAVCGANKELLEGFDKNDVLALSFSGQMMGCVVVDKNGESLRPAIIWADQRAGVEENKLRSLIDEKEFYKITGHKISASYSIEKLMWIKAHQPEIYKNIYKMLQPKDYIIAKLTGKYVTDYSDASGTNCFDINELKWSKFILDHAEIDIDLLPDAHKSTHIAGEISKEIADACGLCEGTKVVIGGGDGVCASVGAGSVEENATYNYLGSSSWISFAAKKPVFDDQMRTFNWVHVVPNMYAPTGTMQAAGNSYQFIKEILCDGLKMQADTENVSVYSKMDTLMSESKVGANGLVYLPYILGERSPRWNRDARGAFIGLKMEHKKGDMLRAAVEGILMNLCIVLDIFKKDCDIEKINIIGGLAQSPVISQILADIYGVKAERLNYLEEATSIGAAVIAGVGIGVFSDFTEVKRFVEVNQSVEPNVENYAKYDKVKKVFDNSYNALLDVYKELSEI